MNSRIIFLKLIAGAILITGAPSAICQTQIGNEGPLLLPAFIARAAQVANPMPGGTFAMPVSSLRYEPRVDVQSRNMAESQADVAIRGGIFENTGFKIGGVALFDPQTGHYFAEIPVPPNMLESPFLHWGVSAAIVGFNANVGTVDYSWRPIEQRGEVSLAVGESRYSRQSVY